PGQQYDKPEPIYRWAYRPEFQFSNYQLTMKELRAENYAADGTQEGSTDILNVETPVLSSDNLLSLLYDLETTDLLPLDYLNAGPEKELIFTLGEQEVKATLGADQTLRFDDLSHLNSLDPEDYLTLRLYANNDMGNVLWAWAFEPIRLIADMNRDGHIIKVATNEHPVVDTQNNTQRPFYFWINDDDDEGEINEGKGSAGDVPNDDNPDHNNGKVDGMRDLVDFFPVYIDVKPALDTFPVTEYTYRLVHQDSALKFTETDLYPTHDSPGLRVDAPLKQRGVAAGLAANPVTTITPGGAALSHYFLRGIQNDRGGVILVEASQETHSPLWLKVVKNADQRVVASTKLSLSISGVEDMYRYLDLKPLATQRGAAPNPELGLAENINDPGNNPDEQTQANYLVFVHGYNVSAKAARGWNAEMFKRFHRLGFNGRFIGVNWHGDTGLDYHHAVYNALQTSMHLNAGLSRAMPEPGPLIIAGHSLGNMVVSNAISQGGLAPSKYFMINAAVPIEAYDSAQTTGPNGATMATNMTEADWADYPEALYAANWHQLFPNNDQRQQLTWRDRFNTVVSVAYNFYSPGEEVVENATEGETVSGNLLARLGDFMSGKGTGRHAWVTQEIGKGCKNFIAGWFVFDNCTSGWDFNSSLNDLEYMGTQDPNFPNVYRRYSPEAARSAIALGTLSEEVISQFGFFREFSHFAGNESQYADLYAPINPGGANIGHNTGDAATASTRAGENETQWDLLASGIPAMSFAAAANPISALDARPIGGLNTNFNMEALRGDAQAWPASRTSSWGKRWLHSDIKNIALPYVHHTFDTMLEIGGGDQ
ncbi:MAG TPA: alpha/beta fold hydrolase, partial [Gammaproteobacteria bacterium]|nr:alpha/beta fold hydrolase [Gammaproteobacteria bacterium]